MNRRAVHHDRFDDVPLENVLFYDESSVRLDMAREYGYGPIGEVVVGDVPKSRMKNVTIMACLGAGGIVAPDIEYGSVNTQRFVDYLKANVVPKLRKGMVFVMDNASFHHAKAAIAVIEATGAIVVFLPPYSPDYNPIENAWSKIKKILRDVAPRTYAELIAALKLAFGAVTASDAAAWSENAGYA